MEVTPKIVIILLLFAQVVILRLLLKGTFSFLLARVSDRVEKPTYSICLDPRDNELKTKVATLMESGRFYRIVFFIIGLATICVNTSGVVTNALHPPEVMMRDAFWGWVELTAFLYAVSGFYDARNTASRLEYVVLWIQRAKAFSLMRFVRFFSPGALFQIYENAVLMRRAEGHFAPHIIGLVPVMQSLLLAVLGLVSTTMKIRLVGYCVQKEPWEWTRAEIILFIAFCNNIVGITDVTMLQMDQILILLFGGMDAKIVATERGTATAVYDKIFDTIRDSEVLSRFEKLVITFTFGPQDLQKLLVELDEDQGSVERSQVAASTSVQRRLVRPA